MINEGACLGDPAVKRRPHRKDVSSRELTPSTADWTQARPAAYRTSLPSDWWPVRALFADLHQEYVARVGGPPPPGDTLRCMYFTCVHPTARGTGVMKNLWAQTVEVARENGYSHITAQVSSARACVCAHA